MAVSREKLYGEIWAEPMTIVAKRYGISSNYLARVCANLKIPTPQRGYWQQLRARVRVKRPALPAPEPGDVLEWVRDGTEPQVATAPTQRKHARRSKGEPPRRHPLVLGMLEHLEQGREAKYAEEKQLRPNKRNIVDIFVTKECAARALDLAHELFTTLERRGHRVTLAPSEARYDRVMLDHRNASEDTTGDDYHYRYGDDRWRGPAKPTLVFVDSLPIGLTLFEMSEYVALRYVGGDQKYLRIGSAEEIAAPRRPHDWTTQHWVASGRLGLHAYAPQSEIRWHRYWVEKHPGKGLAALSTIARELEDAVPIIKAMLEREEKEAEERARKWEVEREKMARIEAERRRVEEEKARIAELKKQIEDWRFVQAARSLAAAAEELVASRGLQVSEGGPLEKWLDGIQKVADEADPLSGLRHEVDKMAKEGGAWPRANFEAARRFAFRRRRWMAR
jgi:hypothetical protein